MTRSSAPHNRIRPYEAGWLSLLVVNGLATKGAIREALTHRAGPTTSLQALHEARVAKLRLRELQREEERERRRRSG
jgi:hypothetical protein